MRTAFTRGATALAVLMFVVSCGDLLKKKGADEDAGAEGGSPATADTAATVDAEAAPAPAPTAATAANEGDIARFPDEAKLANVGATFARTYNVREAPPAGAVVASLPKGAAVTQIAQRDKFFLVTFADPKGSGSTMMGWVHADAFTAALVDAGVKPLVCPTGELALFSDSPFCGKPCGNDKECPAGQACKGSANKLLASGKAGDGVTVCTVYHPHDAGAAPPPPPVVDAGKPADAAAPAPVVDAGKPADAGGPAPTADPAQDVVAALPGNKCPGTFLFVNKTGKCHRPCTGPASCKNRPSYFCIKCDNDTKRVCGETQAQCQAGR